MFKLQKKEIVSNKLSRRDRQCQNVVKFGNKVSWNMYFLYN